jgi:hypothetical protein
LLAGKTISNGISGVLFGSFAIKFKGVNISKSSEDALGALPHENKDAKPLGHSGSAGAGLLPGQRFAAVVVAL